jgi:eukaryotic-like serine/threonine-protein kinase
VRVGRYVLHDEIASGGMASVHLGRLHGERGFSRVVAIKRLHPHLAREPEFVAMLLDEARLSSRIRHPNVVSTTDVVVSDNEVLLVMDYVHGESLAGLLRRSAQSGQRPSAAIVSGILAAALRGLHAAHTATDENGQPLHIVHRDFSQQNLLVGADGVARVVDFGVARAVGRLQTTREGHLKGKLAYMAPEQVLSDEVDARCDVWAAAVVLWECLSVRNLFRSDSHVATINKILSASVDPPSRIVPGIGAGLDHVVMKGLERKRENRWSSAEEMALALEDACEPERTSRIAAWVVSVAGATLEERAEKVSAVESSAKSASVTHLATTPSDGEAGTALVRDDLGNRGQRRRRVASIAGLAAIALAAAAAVWQSQRQAPPSTVVGAPILAAPSAEVPVVPTPRSSIGAIAPPIARSTPPAPAPAPAPIRKVRPPAKPAALEKDCTQPWYWDGRVRRLRPECLH